NFRVGADWSLLLEHAKAVFENLEEGTFLRVAIATDAPRLAAVAWEELLAAPGSSIVRRYGRHPDGEPRLGMPLRVALRGFDGDLPFDDMARQARDWQTFDWTFEEESSTRCPILHVRSRELPRVYLARRRLLIVEKTVTLDWDWEQIDIFAR